MQELPLGYTVETSNFAEYFDECGHRVYWYIHDTESARAEVWRGYRERLNRQKRVDTLPKPEIA